MKKILLILLMILIFSISSCKNGKNNNEDVNYDFISIDEAYAKLTIYQLIVNNSDGSFELLENNDYICYSNASSRYLLDKTSKQFYEVDVDNKRLYKSSASITVDEIRDNFISYLIAHLDTVDGNYSLEEGVSFNSFTCDKYTLSSKTSSDTFYIDQNTGFAVGRKLIKKSTTSWDIAKLSFDEEAVNERLNTYTAYSVALHKPVMYTTSWPYVDLTSSINPPESGDFSLAIDYGNSVLIIYDNISLAQVKNYVATIKATFAVTFEETNEIGQYFYNGYNEADQLFINITFEPTQNSCGITIYE